MELRQNAATREWIIFAPERAHRRDEFESAPLARTIAAFDAQCPFCPGNEVNTPGESLRYLNADGSWQVRAFPNRYPVMEPDGHPTRQGDLFHRRLAATGCHELIADSPRHDMTLALMEPSQVRLVVLAWAERVRVLRALPGTDHLVVFKNHGAQAGTSLVHPHCQIVSLPVAPWQVRYRTEQAMRFYDDHGECVFCRMLEQERTDGQRVVVAGQHFTAFVPYAAYSPFSAWLLPHRHTGCITQHDDAELDDLARVVRELLWRMYHKLRDPSYNLVLRLPSRDSVMSGYCHWYIALVPRLGKSAGFEMGTGMFINTSLPENDAAALRSV
jgi:UDPglucose--hexose-1-phosphate uridylyltransferase